MARWPINGTSGPPSETEYTELMEAVQPGGFVLSGFTLSDGGGTDLDVAAGSAFVRGTYVASDATQQVTVGSANTYDVWLLPDGTLEWAATPSDADAISLGYVTGDGAGITGITYDRSLNGAAEVYRRKTSDQTTASSSLADDSDLQFEVAAGEVWEVRASLIADIQSGASTSQIQLQLQAPSGWVSGTVFASCQGDASTGYAFGDGRFNQDSDYTATAAITKNMRLDTTSALQAVEVNAVVAVGEDAGTFKLRHARVNGSGTLYVREGSVLVARRIR